MVKVSEKRKNEWIDKLFPTTSPKLKSEKARMTHENRAESFTYARGWNKNIVLKQF
ncbi:hypothetical protein HMPREF9087_2857 [Enterococcus casseliflavus ATCC 12755]|jgi:hypothetical protein|uniref:Uncharacterized protein n=1 Tax=Enterococcus casseliflavus ATCC 12755 TaxID=888066 RepID=F0EN65_ENTCA|nr:hypothetical protein HMPREF9087_2857 [Enterococcus casseliflavus ATCC 12755]EPH89906.1 hypothetical protein D922_03281 [Enterococcus faecalis 06-MB-DW-09]